jgi:glycosyltransferase involved in cell wall biosynthesis
MNIFLNARFLTQPITGVQRYALELVKELDELIDSGEIDGNKYRFVLLSPKSYIHQLELKHIPHHAVGRFGGHLWEQLELPIYAKKGLLINLCNTGPLMKRNQIATIHDTAVFEYPQSFSFTFRNAYRVIQKNLAKVSKKVVTVSFFSKSQIITHCRINEKKIEVIYEGKEHMVDIEPDPDMLQKYGLQADRYILAVSSMNPNKNFHNIVKAFELLKEMDYEIVIAGGANPRIFQMTDTLHSNKLKMVGYVTDSELKALYQHAACFIYPSIYEGFGLPPLEAMSCGAPVILSNAASLPEVFGEAPIYCDPANPIDMASKMKQIMGDATLRNELRAKGFKRVKNFTWTQCARQTFSVIKEVGHL